jgi:hypothetical protein
MFDESEEPLVPVSKMIKAVRERDRELAEKDAQIQGIKHAPARVRALIGNGELKYLFDKHENKQAALATIRKIEEEINNILTDYDQ